MINKKSDPPLGQTKNDDAFLKDKKILIIDDDELNRTILRRLLEIKGALIAEAESGRIAVDIFNESHFDLLITDIQMEDMDGNELALQLQTTLQEKRTPLIALTGDDNELQINMKNKLFDAVLIKPISAQHLYAAIAKCLRND